MSSRLSATTRKPIVTQSARASGAVRAVGAGTTYKLTNFTSPSGAFTRSSSSISQLFPGDGDGCPGDSFGSTSSDPSELKEGVDGPSLRSFCGDGRSASRGADVLLEAGS